MGKVWVRLRGIYRREENGQLVTYHPPSWVEVWKNEAQAMLASGQAEIMRPTVRAAVLNLAACGVHCVKGDGKKTVAGFDVELAYSAGDLDLPYAKTLLWDVSCPLRANLIAIGFERVDRWQVAVPLLDYRTLACQVGTDDERALTESICHDLRVLLYDPRLVYVRRCETTEKLIELWKAERKRGKNDSLAFLRAMYQAKPVLCALPTSWKR